MSLFLKLYYMCRSFLITVLGFLFVVSGVNAAAVCPDQTFLQIYQTSHENHQPDFSDIFRQTRILGFNTVILQWSSYDNVSFYPDRAVNRVSHAVLPEVIAAGCDAGIRLHLGLHHDSELWKLQNQSDADVKKYLEQRLSDLKLQLAQLAVVIEGMPEGCLSGWYITDEIDDTTWRGKLRQKLLLNYLAATTRLLRTARPNWPIAISGFTNQVKSPQAFAGFWDRLMTETSINQLYFQDGIGANKLTPESATQYLEALNAISLQRDYEVIAILELFKMQEQSGKKTLISASPARVSLQLELISRLNINQAAVFAAMPYLIQHDMPGSQKLAAYWRKYVLTSCNISLPD